MCYTTYFSTFVPKFSSSTYFKSKIIMLSEKIGNNAGLVWSALENGELSVKLLKKATKLTEKDLNLALGWLAREGKVVFNELDGELFISLV